MKLSPQSLLVFTLCAAFLTAAGAEKPTFRKNNNSPIAVTSKSDDSLNSGHEESFQESLAKLHIPDDYKLEEIVIGNERAPHTVVIYLSFTCSHCGDFFNGEFQEIRKKYVNAGVIKMYLRSYLDDIGALEAASIVRCLAGKSSNMVLELSQKVFANQEEWRKSKNPREFLKDIFKVYGKSKIEDCCKSKKISAGLMKEQQRAHELKIIEVPAFVVDGEVYHGKLTCEKLGKILKRGR
ncbi:MAG: DsbA family protein [Holosporaceae bacterium]|nr:DsbA family protein [Holosporaceae bacterium]